MRKFSKTPSKSVIIKRTLFDFTPFILMSGDNGHIITTITVYLGRYQHMHPYFGITGAAAAVTHGLTTMISSGISTTTGLYYSFVPLKAKLTLTIKNLETDTGVVASVVEVPFNTVSTIVTNYAEDLKLLSKVNVLLDQKDTSNSVKTIVINSDIPRINGLSQSQYIASEDFHQTKSGLGGKYSNWYYQFHKLDGSTFTAGVDYSIKAEFVIQPIQRNFGLIE